MATRPPSATAMPTRVTVPCGVVTCSSTMAWPAAWAATGTVFCVPAIVVSGMSVAVTGAACPTVRGASGDMRNSAEAAAAAAAARPTSTMSTLRAGWRGGALRSMGDAGRPAPTSLGWRHNRSSGSTHPRRGASASSAPPPCSSGPGSAPSGSSGVSVTTVTIPIIDAEMPSPHGTAVP